MWDIGASRIRFRTVGKIDNVKLAFEALRANTGLRDWEAAMAALKKALFILVLGVTAASAAEFPSRKAGLWILSVKSPDGRAVSMQQCVDAKTDAALQSMSGNMAQRACSKRDVQRSGDTITIDSVCTIAGRTSTTHAVITGSFDSNYTMVMTSQGEGGPTRSTTMTAKWSGPCAAGQKPGDMIMANGFKMNILEMQNGAGRPGMPVPPSR
jgi:hypothetical protein